MESSYRRATAWSQFRRDIAGPLDISTAWKTTFQRRPKTDRRFCSLDTVNNFFYFVTLTIRQRVKRGGACRRPQCYE